MNTKKLLLLAVIPMVGVVANAQTETDYTPKKNDITVAMTLGYSDYLSISAVDGTMAGSYQMAALSNEWNQKQMALGLEFGYFSGDTWKWTVSAGISFVGNPGYQGKEGTFDEGAPAVDADGVNTGDIPSYRAVASQTTTNYNIGAGFAKYFRTAAVPNLMPYIGFHANFAYGRNAMRYDEYASMGKSVAESFNLRGAATCGIDYFLTKGFYFGIQIDPVAYTYNVTKQKPQEGLGTLKGDSHNLSVLATPTAKIGFKF